MSEAQTTLGDASTAELKQISIEELELTELRDVREPVVGEIKERITTSGYNPARPLRVVPRADTYAVADGNHRLKALQELGVRDTVPCVVEPNRDLLAVAVESNQDEDTYAEPDLFDELDYIAREKERGLTLKEIVAKVDGWGEGYVKKRSRLLSNTVPRVRDMARGAKRRLGTEKVPSGTFTEGWFRNSGLYDLQDGKQYPKPDEDRAWHPQVRLMDWFIRKKNVGRGRGGGQIADIAEKINGRCEQLEIIDDELNPGVDDDAKQDLVDGVTRGAFTDDSLRDAIENINAEAQDTAEFGTGALKGLNKLEDNSVACVLTDPPYGVDFKSHDDSGTHEYGIDSDEYEDLMRATFEELQRVCMDNAHLYIFFAAKRFDEITTIASEFFDVTMTPLIWLKNNGSPTQDKGGYEKQYAQYYEQILFCRMSNGRSRSICPEGEQRKNVLEYDRPSGEDRRHDSQKPRALLRDLITNSTGPSETVLDPFAGSGATLLAAKEAGRHYKGFELSEEPEPGFRKALSEVTGDD